MQLLLKKMGLLEVGGGGALLLLHFLEEVLKYFQT